MRIPRTLLIGGHRIKVKYVDTVDKKDESCVGLADTSSGEILIRKRMKRSMQEATFFHEALHHMNVSINHALLDSIAEQMYQMLKVNKMLK